MNRAAVPGRDPDGALRHPLYREVLDVGTCTEDADGITWRYDPRWLGDPMPWVVVCADE
jgi:hypothetical protein